MTPDEIKKRASEFAAFYVSKSNGKTLQQKHGNQWWDVPFGVGPSWDADFSLWRVKPEPRRIWVVEKPGDDKEPFTIKIVWDETDAEHLKICGFSVTKFVEVMP